MDKQAARDNAVKRFFDNLMEPEDVWDSGFDAGYKSACGDWVRIETDGLPTEAGQFNWRTPNGVIRASYYNPTSFAQRHYVEMYIAWMRIPPFTEPLTDNEGGENDKT